MINKRIGLQISLGLASMLAAFQLSAQNRELGATGEMIEGIAAIVDEGIVLKSELEMRVALVVENYQQQQAQLPIEQRSPLPPEGVLRDQVLDQLVIKELQLQRADRLGIVVGDDILNEALANVAGGLGLTLEDLPAALASEGIDYNMYRQDSRNDIILTQLQQRDVFSRIRVSPRELDQCLLRNEARETDEFDYNISHILIGLSRNATQDDRRAAEARAEDIKERLEQGADFAQLALTYSEGPTALEGGSLGWRKGSQLPTVFADTVIQMKPGEVSDIITSASGFHIVKLNDMRGAERIMVDQVHARHILVSPNEILDDDAAHQKAIGFYDRIKAGEDFAEIAQASSEDTVSAAEGGDLGWNTPDAYVPEFAQVLESLAIGEISEPIRSPFGWHIIEVLERRSYDTTDDRKAQQCQQEIRASKAEEERLMWIQQMRDQAYVEKRI